MASNISDLDFDGQRPDETTLFVFRRSLFVIKRGVLLLLLLIAITVAPLFFFVDYINVIWFLPIIGLAVGLICLLYSIFIWYFTVYIVTNQRIRYINQKSFFSSEVVDLSLSKIENIRYNIAGLFGSIVGFGTIVVQTLAGDLIIHNVSHPDLVYNKLQDLVAKQTVENNYDQSSKEDNEE